MEFQYCIVFHDIGKNTFHLLTGDHESQSADINQLGLQGWELVGAVPGHSGTYLYFRNLRVGSETIGRQRRQEVPMWHR